MKAWIDKNIEKFLSRKLLVWVTTTTLLTFGFIDGEQWTAISLGYIGSQGVADIAIAWKSGLNKS